MMRFHRRAAASAAVLVMTVCALGACSDPTAEIERVAADAASALESGMTSVLWGDDADLRLSLTNLADLPRTVDVVEIGEPRTLADIGPRAADIVLRWAWDLDEDGTADWTYTTEARISENVDGRWVAPYDPSMLAAGLSSGGELRLVRIPAQRGELLAADGTVIVTDRPVRRIGIDKTRLPGGTTDDQLHAAATSVAELTGLTDPAAYAERVLAAGPRAFVEALTVREENPGVDLTALDGLPGAVALSAELPLAPTPTWARPLLGRVGEATAEIVDASRGAIKPGDQVGLSGLQRTYDKHLRGTPGLAVISGTGDDAQRVFERAPVDGEDLVLSLDTAMQTAAEQALEDTDTPTGLIALRPSTGDILAAASGPGSAGQNIAMEARLAPGSTFKMVTALALLRAGVGPDATVACTPEATVSGYSIGNYPGYPAAHTGDISLTQALAQSCNTALIHARDHLTASDLAEAAASLGLGQPRAVAWPGFTGSVPHDMTETELAASLIGQGDILASPLAMATVAASISAGTTVTPTLVHGPEELADNPAQSHPLLPLTPEEAAVLNRYMRAVVTDGTGVLLADIPGEPIHAKTGSAEAGNGDSYRVDSWMIAHQGDLAVAALVHGGGHGADAAGAAVEKFLRTVNQGT